MISLYIPEYVGAFQSYQIFMMSNLHCLCFLNKNSFLKCPVLPDELLMQLTTRWQQSTMYVCSLTGQNKLIHFFFLFSKTSNRMQIIHHVRIGLVNLTNIYEKWRVK